MKKIIRLTESDIRRIVGKILQESSQSEGPEMPETPSEEYLDLIASSDGEQGNDQIDKQQVAEYHKINQLKRLIRTVLSEGISNASTIFSSHPGDIPATDFFPSIIPNQYSKTYDGPGGKWWQNSCASKMSMAMAKAGFPVPGGYTTEVNYNGVPAGTKFNPSSQSFSKIFNSKFGKPTITGNLPDPKVGKDGIPRAIKGRKGVYVFTTNAWSDAAGHVDAFDGTKSAGGHEYWNMPGSYQFWAEPTKLEINTKKCGWGNDTKGYELSGWRCHDIELSKKKPCPAINAKKCGYGDDVKSYRLSGWKCKTKF